MTALALQGADAAPTSIDWRSIDWAGCQEAASPYREGNEGMSLAQGESLAMVADPLVFCQSIGGETGN